MMVSFSDREIIDEARPDGDYLGGQIQETASSNVASSFLTPLTLVLIG